MQRDAVPAEDVRLEIIKRRLITVPPNSFAKRQLENELAKLNHVSIICFVLLL